jgi:hypothetical protein
VSKLFALQSGFEVFLDILLSNFSSQFKQQALLFDSIGIPNLATFINAFESINVNTNDIFSSSLIELKWLIHNGIVFEPSVPSQELQALLMSTLGTKYAKEYSEVDKEILRLTKRRKKAARSEQEINNIFLTMAKKDAIVLRLLSAQMGKDDNPPAIAALSETDYTYEIPNSKKREVIQVVITKLPIPDNTVPWEKIIDYRNDSDNQGNLLGLRRWIKKISTEELSKAEIEDEIDWRINEFQKHMKYHKIKANTETLEILVKAPLEIIENLIKVKLSKIPDPFFVLKKRQLMLMEAEINAPDKELAYIIKTRETFHPQE